MSDFDNNLYQDAWLQLLVRAGFADLAEILAKKWGKEPTGIPFQFDDNNWQKLEQMQAVVEFYLNCNDPWKSRDVDEVGANKPVLPDLNDPAFKSAEDLKTGFQLILIDGFGARNNIHEKDIATGTTLTRKSSTQVQVTLKTGEADKFEPVSKQCWIWFHKDTKRASGSYRITDHEIEKSKYTFILDGEPSASIDDTGNQGWTIIKNSAWLQGDSARVIGSTIKLDSGIPLADLKPGFCEIKFPSSAHPEISYPILQIAVRESSITIDGMPDLISDSKWIIRQKALWQIGKTAVVVKKSGNKKTQTVKLIDSTEQGMIRIDERKNKDLIQFPELQNGSPEHGKDLFVITDKDVKKQTITITGISGDGLMPNKNYQWVIAGESIQWEGKSAQIIRNVIELDGDMADFTQVNAGMDTVYFKSDTANPLHAYRVVKIDKRVDEKQKKTTIITVNGTPQFDNNSPWHIPAGIGGRLPPMKYTLKQQTFEKHTGFDHYDGVLFVVKDGNITGRFRFTSYTSLGTSAWSIRGNDRYGFMSWKPGKEWISYAFCVPQTEETNRRIDKVARSYAYGLEPLGIIGLKLHGLSGIFMHLGFSSPGGSIKTGGTGSEGCLVSPNFESFRRHMIELRLLSDVTPAQRTALNAIAGYSIPHGDNEYRETWGFDKEVYGDKIDPKTGKKEVINWINFPYIIKGTLWLVRPDELPLTVY